MNTHSLTHSLFLACTLSLFTAGVGASTRIFRAQ